MLLFKGMDFRNFIEDETNSIKHRRDFVETIEKDYILRANTRRGVLVTGLRSTGKTIGVLQAIEHFPSDKMIFVSPTSREETISKNDVLDILKNYDADLIFIDEYSWLKSAKEDDKDRLADYLVGKAQEGVKVIITGTDSTKINSLLNTDFIHRAVEINTTYFSYDEYCRLYDLQKNDDSMKDFLIKGGIFENHIYQNFGSMERYIKDAIIDNLASYYPKFDKELIKATVYKIFYDCICKNYIKNDAVPVYSQGRTRLIYEDYLENFGIDTGITIPPNVLNEMFGKLKEIGVVVQLEDMQIPNRKRAYITNQSISAQLTKCIYELDELPERYLGDLYEATVVCYEYMEYVHNCNSPYKMYYIEGRKSDYEIDFVLCDSRRAYLFDCKLNNNDNIRINDSASIVKDIIPNLLGDRDLCGRYIIYQGNEKWTSANGKDLICTNNWNVNFEEFEKQLEILKHGEVEETPSLLASTESEPDITDSL